MVKVNFKIVYLYLKDVERYEGIVIIYYYKWIWIKYFIGLIFKILLWGWFEILNRDILFVLLLFVFLKVI